jgi:hypothetical protein
MGGVFGATSTTDEVLAGVNLRGKRILVTGVSAGLGDCSSTHRARRARCRCSAGFGQVQSGDRAGAEGR